MSQGKLAWRWARLAAMSPAEITWRVQEEWQRRWEGMAAGRERYRPWRDPVGDALRASLVPLVPEPAWRDAFREEFPADYERLGKRARAAREGRVMLFAREYAVGAPPDWHFDPGSRAHAPQVAAAKLDYRDLGKVGSARRIWELNRHHHLTEVALWAWAARDHDAARFVAEEWRDWCKHNPPLVGINWTSGLELAIRTISWAEMLALLLDLEGAAPDAETLALVVGAWARQIEHVRAHDSRFSSANNHRIGEAAAVAIAGHALPFHPQAAEWWSWGKSTLEEEILLQIAPDGVGREQAFAYQRFVIDFAMLVSLFARARGEDLSSACLERLGRACDFLAAVSGPEGRAFAVGDDDEGRALGLGEEWEDRTAASLECAGWWLDEPRWRTSRHPRARWLGLARDEEPATTASTRSTGAIDVRAFPEGGYAVVEGEAGRAPLRALFDAGPLGFGALAAHGHADALSFLVRLGEDLLIDPGTGSYHGDPDWREELRGTRAHNTVEIDGLDQSERRGLFLWGRRAEARLIAAGGRARWFTLAGRHDGYAPTGIPETRRAILGHAGEGGLTLLVVDEALGKGAHVAVTRWQLGEGIPVPAEPGPRPGFRVRYPGGAEVVLRASALVADAHEEPSVRADCRFGGDGDERAEYSPRFEERAPAGRVSLRLEGVAPLASAWLIAARPAEARGLERTPLAPGTEVATCEGGLLWTRRLDQRRVFRALVVAPGRTSARAGAIRLEGRAAAWVEGESPVEGEPFGVVVGATLLEAGPVRWGPAAAPITGVLSLSEARPGGGTARTVEERVP
ncbi:MAG TPA: alginate lyase family protein [Candidatus Eisenbacteria bacterium]|nr:alginate lyase family protein [Candidatus Eisenbacteria bacterium]